jgi:hypothetical protein
VSHTNRSVSAENNFAIMFVRSHTFLSVLQIILPNL